MSELYSTDALAGDVIWRKGVWIWVGHQCNQGWSLMVGRGRKGARPTCWMAQISRALKCDSCFACGGSRVGARFDQGRRRACRQWSRQFTALYLSSRVVTSFKKDERKNTVRRRGTKVCCAEVGRTEGCRKEGGKARTTTSI